MITAIPEQDILNLLAHQLHSMFILSDEERGVMNDNWRNVKERLIKNFSNNPNKYYNRNGEPFFNPYHSGQYTIFLYFYSVAIHKAGCNLLADKIYYLNRQLNGCDLFYEVNLPDLFCIDHPLGSVMGRAKYSDGFCFIQNCTVGNNRCVYPTIGRNVTMYAGSAIIGDCHIGDNVQIGAQACVKDQDIPDNSIVFGSSPNLIIKLRK